MPTNSKTPIHGIDVAALKGLAIAHLVRLAKEERDDINRRVSSADDTTTVADFAGHQASLESFQALLLAIRIIQGDVTLEGKEVNPAGASPIPEGVKPKFELEDAIRSLAGAKEGNSNAVGDDKVRVQRAG